MRTMSFTNLDLQVRNRIAYVTINNPPANVLSTRTIQQLSDCIEEIAENTEVKSVILTGAGKFFVAGADIKEFETAFGNKEKGEEMSRTAQRLFDRIEQLKKPVIAAINGACLGGGLELAMSCHLRIAADEAKLGLPELKLGLIPAFGGTQRLARITNQAKALELILTSKFITGEEAERMGLVNQSVPLEEVIPTAEQLAHSITGEKSAVSVAAALEAVTKGLETTLDEGLKLEAEFFGELFKTEDMQEGVLAFIEKRQAQFKDK